jgi:hypothetical protein
MDDTVWCASDGDPSAVGTMSDFVGIAEMNVNEDSANTAKMTKRNVELRAEVGDIVLQVGSG